MAIQFLNSGYFAGSVALGSGNISMSSASAGQLQIAGAGYTGAIALDATAMYIYHNSSSRDLVLGTNETARITIDGSSGSASFTDNIVMANAKILYTDDIRASTGPMAVGPTGNSPLTLRSNGTTRLTIGSAGLATFSSTPIVLTRSAGDNTTYAASTAFVTTAVAAVPIGDYLPLIGGTLTGPLVIDTAGGAEKMTFNNEFNTAPIADTFSGNTSKSYISFGVVAGSNDPGFIMHESSATETNEGVLHLCPSDDNSTGDYVSIHGSNDPDVLNLHTSGLIETVNLQLQIKSGLNDVYVNDGLLVQDAGTFGGNLSVNGSNITLNGSYPRFNMYSTDAGEDDYSIINNNGIFGIYNNTEAFFPFSLAETSGNATFSGSVGVGGSPGAKLDVNAGTTNTVAIFESTDDKAFIRIKDDDTDTYLISKDNKFSIGESSSDYDNFKVDISNGNTTIGGDLIVNGTTTLGNQLTFPYGSIGDYIYHTGDGNTYFGFPSNDNFNVTAGGNLNFAVNVNQIYLNYQGSTKLITTSTGVSVTGGAVVAGAMSSFETTLTNNDDYLNSPISILERANIGSGSTADKYAPNLNFHWGGLVSNSFWMAANGTMNYGSYSGAGTPAIDGTFATGNLVIANAITANTGAFTGQVTGPTPSTTTSFANKAYVDAHDGGAGVYLPLAGGTMTGDIVMQDELLNFKSGGSSTLPQFTGIRNATDLNNRSWTTEGGWAYTTFDNGTSNQPSAGLHNANGLLSFNTHSGDYMAQIAMTTNTGKLWHRRRNGGSWLTWYQIYSTQDFSTTDISNWNTAYANMVTAVAITGTTTKTITLTQQDGGTVSNTFTAGVVQSVTTGNSDTITIGGTTANPTVAANTAAVSITSANLATGAQIQTAINEATTGALKFVSEWSASGTAGGSPDLRATGTHEPGNYYIVSVAGSATPNGAGTTPNEWAVGDWCIRADLATDTWQKIDNTQVGNVTGSGSAGKVAYWNSNTNITNDGDLLFDGANLTVGGNIIGTSNNTTELGTYPTGAISRIRMRQGGELHFGDTTTAAPLGITEGDWNQFADQDRLSIYGRNSIKFYAGSIASSLKATLQSTGLTLNTITNATSDTDKFLVSDSGIIKYRTGAQVRSDIGAGTGSGNVTTSGLTAGRVSFATSSTNIEDDGDFVFDSSNNVLFTPGLLTANTRVSNSQHYPTGHYTPGETIWEIDPTWSDKQLQEYFNRTNVSWATDSIAQDAPGGYAIYINGAVSIGGVYGSGFPYIPVDNDGVYYMECYIKNVGVNTHYMGSNEFNATFASTGGNPGSFGYWVMANTNPGTSWTKVSGYIGGFDSSQTGKFELATKYWTPQALFNYTNSSGTRACYISGWKAVRVDAPGNRYFDDNVNIGLNSLPTTRLQVSASGANGIDISEDTADADSSGRLFFSTDTASEGVSLMNSAGSLLIRTGAQPGATSGTTKFQLTAAGNATLTGKLNVTADGTGGAPTLDIINNSSSTFNHSAELMTPNMTDEQNNILVIGRVSSTKNAGYIGWKYKGGAGSNENILTFGHWGSDNLMNLDGLGNLGIGTQTPSAKLHVVGTGLFTGLVSGITPTADANFVTKAYADALTPGAGVYLPLAGGTMTGKAVFPSAIASRPQLPGGFIAIDTGDADVDIWGISRDYYPSNPTTANAWGLKWGSSPNQFQWVGAGVNRITFDLDQGNIVTLGNITAPTATITTLKTNNFQNTSGNTLFTAGNTTTGASRSLNLRSDASTGDPSTSDDSNSTGITWGQRTDSTPYYIIYPNLENYNSSGNYSKLTLAWHTGIKIGAAAGYGGTRFYSNSPDVSGAGVILNVGVGNSNIGVVNNLTVGGQATGPAPTTTTSYANKAYVDAHPGSGGTVTSIATTNGITGGTITSTGTIQVDDTVARVYKGTSTGVSNSAYKTAFTVNGGNLSSHIRFSVQGTAGSVVVSNLIDLAVNHYQDIQLTALSGNYTRLSVKVISNNNEDYEVQFKTNSANAVTLYLEVFPLGSETIVFTSTSSFTGTTGTFADLPYGNYMNGTGGDEGDLFIGGNFTVQGGDIVLNGTGRVQGIDTVSASTDAANKAYVDAHPGTGGTVTSVNVVTDGDALNVTSNTITGSGTMTLPWQGGSNQYVNGLGNAIDFPTIPQGTVTGTGTANVLTKWNSAGTGIEDTSISVVESGASRLYTINGGATGSGINLLTLNKNTGGSSDSSLLFRVGTTQNDIVSDSNYNTALLRFRLANAAGTESTILSLNANGDSIFSGNVTVGANTTQNGTNPGLKIQSTNTAQTVLGLHNTTSRNWELAVGGSANGVGAGSFYIYDNTANDARFIIDTSGNATVDGTVTANGVLLTGGGEGVTSIATTSPILGGTITTSGTISLLQPASGAWFRGVSVIGSDGLMEVGRYIDFHNSNTSTADYDVRLDCYSANNLRLTGSLNVTQDIVANSQLGVGITPAAGISLEVDGKIRADDSNSGDYIQMYCDGSVTGDSFIENTNSSIVIKSANATTRIDASGAAANLEVLNASNVATIRLRGAADSFIAGGDLGIGNTGPVSGIKLDVTGKVLIKTSDGVSDLYMGNYSTAKYVRFHTNNSNTYFDMNCGHIYWRLGSSTKYDFDIANGNMQIDGTLTQSSDIRLKENITEISDCISKVQAMRGVYYNKTESNTEDIKIGVIAQEVEAVLPELVIENEDDGLKSVAYSELTAVLINAIKEQQEIIEDLKTRITKLEN